MIQITRIGTQPDTYQLLAQQSLSADRDTVFALFADPFQLQQITPPWLHFAVCTPRPISMQTGTLIDYRLRLHGLPLRWQSQITVWDPPACFVDEQQFGPYRQWRHEHTFVAEGHKTRIVDRVTYQVPGGRWIHRLLVRSNLRKIFQYRQQVLADLFSETEPQSDACPSPRVPPGDPVDRQEP